jgi:uncharacterized membrane protein YhiD involved in acid resistance
MINRIYTALAAAGIILLALFGIHRSGKQSGKQEQQAKHDAQEIQRQEAHINEVKRHQEIISRNASTHRDDVIDSLQGGEF